MDGIKSNNTPKIDLRKQCEKDIANDKTKFLETILREAEIISDDLRHLPAQEVAWQNRINGYDNIKIIIFKLECYLESSSDATREQRDEMCETETIKSIINWLSEVSDVFQSLAFITDRNTINHHQKSINTVRQLNQLTIPVSRILKPD